MDQVLGNDRVNTSPSLAVDNSRGPRRGNIYLVYANNNSGDGADIVFQIGTAKYGVRDAQGSLSEEKLKELAKSVKAFEIYSSATHRKNSR